MPPKDAANWTANPADITKLLAFLHGQRSRVGEGGNWDKTVLNEVAAHMASLGPPAKGGPKTATAIGTKWGQIRKIFEAILQMKQKAYPGASGWTYTDEGGFNVTDETQDAWENFSKAHPVFKPFATSGWVHFRTVDEIMPSRARGRFVFSAGSTQPVMEDAPSQPQSQDDDDTRLPATTCQPPAPSAPPAASQHTPTPSVSGTPAPASTRKRPLSQEVDSPWSNKRSRVTGPESILALSHSVAGVGNVIESVFAQHKSSAMSPTKKVQAARKLALEDMNNGYIMSDERTRLSILFGRDTSAADAYIADEDPILWADVARELLNPTQNFSF
ncbi:Myb-like domain-containing protein [Mycena venus]|uniref:Myb-like domain-containing protein n=1 Tax=Mycena venus TaxID=2733690 RepID=A0A8H7D490_9AGAR|nr:Myb-like domain-containing protein [Mycena venus]